MVSSFHVGDDLGSDHLPLEITLELNSNVEIKNKTCKRNLTKEGWSNFEQNLQASLANFETKLDSTGEIDSTDKQHRLGIQWNLSAGEMYMQTKN